MNETENKKLFKHYLTEYKNYNQERPQFLYRIERWRFNTILRRPFHIAPWYTFNGWLLKGCIAYLAYYFLLKKQPVVKHWNREGYYYEPEHKTSSHAY